MPPEVALACRAVVKRYADVVAVDGLDLQVFRGECFGLLGPNGAGKTTTIEMLEGLLTPDAGEVEVLGQRWADAGAALRPRLGIQLQETQLADKLSVSETLRLFRSFYPSGRTVPELLALVGLESKASAWVGKLSGGQRQRLSVACALAGNPDVLFLDEPTTGLDPQSRLQLWDVLRRFKAGGGTIVLTTHYMDEAATLCDRIGVVDRGRLIALGTPEALVQSLGTAHVVEVTFEGGTPPPGEWFTALPGVVEARVADGVVTLGSSAIHATIPAVLTALADAGAAVLELRTHSATLEDVFVALTGRHLRDG
ncbi:MAG: ABC transporter ATP-binding protein [Acidobacteria bacterium]|nr:ABC transporter ATP-binding protein [Acidobacteriota bacterium]